MITLSTADKALKTVYLGVVGNQLNYGVNPLLAKIKQTTNNVYGNEIVKGTSYGISGGVSAGTEDGALPKAHSKMYSKFRLTLKNLYGTLEITDKECNKSDTGFSEKVNLTGVNVLLAEDNELNAEIAMEILKEAGFVTERAEDGQACVEMLKQAPAGYYDLILMDIQMPNMDGYKATQTIRKLSDPKKAGITIVAMTANAFEEDKQNAYKAGMNWHIAKPIKIDELMAALTEILKE